MTTPWHGIFPAVTTPFTDDFRLDEAAFAEQLEGQLEAGVHGLVVAGSLGESSTLAPEEKLALVRQAAAVSAGHVPVLCGVAERSTDAACRFAEAAATAGADGFMVLPPLLYASDARETSHYLRAVARAGGQPVMVYNNPISYHVDVTPGVLEDLADEPLFVAVKESSGDVRRVTELLGRLGDRYAVFTGVDNLALESLAAGAAGWVAGLVCAFPHETVALYELVRAGRLAEAQALYQWFRPLLDLDVSPQLVQNIKLTMALVGRGSEAVRPPRLALEGATRAHVEAVVARALATRPAPATPLATAGP